MDKRSLVTSRLRRVALACAAILAIAIGAWLARDVIAARLLETAMRLATGYTLHIGKAQFGRAHGVLFDAHVMHGTDPVLDAERVDFDYALRDIFPGGEHRFGFVGITIKRPHLFLVRHKDGSFNIAALGGQSNVPSATRHAAEPYFFTVRVTDGTLDLLDVVNLDPRSRDVRIDRIQGEASVKTSERTRYHVDGVLLDGKTAHPIHGRATIDIAKGYALHRITASNIPIGAIANYFIDSGVAQVLSGNVRDLDLRLYALGVTEDAPIEYHIGGRAKLEGLGMKLDVLSQPVLGVGGELLFADNAVSLPKISGSIGTTALHGGGSIYDFTDPKFRIAIRASEDLALLHRDFSFLKTEPLEGPVDATTLLEGPVGNPLIFVAAHAPRITYRGVPVHDFRATIGYHDGVVLAGDVSGSVGLIHGRLAGRFLTGGKDVDSVVAVDARGEPGAIPYLDRVAPKAAGHITAIAAGTGLQVDAHGILTAAGGDQSVLGSFALGPTGVGELGPFSVRQGAGRLDATLFMDREHGTSGLWATASKFRIFPASPASSLAVLPIPAFPPIEGEMDGRVAGVDIRRHLILAGEGAARDARFAGTRIDDARAVFAGSTEGLTLAGIDARGEFGRFVGRGNYGTDGFAFAGDLDGTLEGMRRWTGDLGAHGRIRGPVTIVSSGDRTVVQTPGVTFQGASVHGLALHRMEGTMGITSDALTVYAADAGVGSGRAVARGESREGIFVSTSDMHATDLHGTGIPIGRGRVLAQGAVRLSPRGDPSFDGGAALVGGNIAGHRVDASTELGYAGDTLSLHDGTGHLAALTFGFVNGEIANLSTAPRYDLGASVRAGNLGALSRTFKLPIPYLRGSLEGDFRIGGAGRSPVVAGTMQIPEGSVNGLAFAGGRADVAVDRDGIAATHGTITVGSTQAQFSGLARGRDLGLRLDSASADLADFNDFFNPADTLAGKGAVHARFAQSGGVTLSGGDFDIDNLRVRRYPFGHTNATWDGERGEISGQIAVDGSGGSLRANGTAAVPRGSTPLAMLTQSQFDVNATMHGFDLNVWLPALGYSPPVLGHVDATGRIRGRYPNLALDVDGEMLDGRVGKLPIERAHIAVGAANGRMELRAADIDFASLSLTGTGSFAFGEKEALALDLQAHSDRFGTFVNSVFSKNYDLDGMLDARLTVSGTPGEPHASAGFELRSLRFQRLVIPSFVASADIFGDRIALRDATVSFQTGTATLAGAIPLAVHPFGPGPPDAPVSFDVDVRNVTLDQFAGLLPAGTRLGGAVEGLFGVRGTIAKPQLVGALQFAGGSYTGPVETEPITGMRGAFEFDGTTAQLRDLAATVGGGSFRGSGSITLPSLTLPSLNTPYYDLDTTLSGVRVAFADYGSSRLDGKVSLRRDPTDSFGTLGGEVSLTDASIPLGAFLRAGAANTGPQFSIAAALPAVAAAPVEAGVFHLPPWVSGLGLGLTVNAGNNVRIRSAILDVGGKGAIKLAGHIAAPSLDGLFEATPGGTLFLNRPFKVQEARVRFTPDNGIAPSLFARATTSVGNPSTDITVTAQGIVPDVRLSYSSSPPYDEATIVGLLFGAYGGTPPPMGLNAFAPTTNIMLPPNAFQQSSTGTFQLSTEAASLINAQFTARLLAPIEQGLGGALGLSDLSLNLGPTGSFAIQARRLLGRNVSFLYGTSLTYPYRMTFGIESRPSPQTSVLFTVFTQQGLYSFGAVRPDAYLSSNPYLGSAADLGGTQGFTVNIQRLFR